MPRHAAVRKAHKAVHRAAKHRPGTLAKVGALLAAPVPDVELLIGAMANPDSGIKFVLGIVRKAGRRISEVQSVMFDKLKWTSDAAKAWLKEHGFTTPKADEAATFWRFRQADPKKYKEYRTVVPGTQRNPTSHFYPEDIGPVHIVGWLDVDPPHHHLFRTFVNSPSAGTAIDQARKVYRMMSARGVKVFMGGGSGAVYDVSGMTESEAQSLLDSFIRQIRRQNPTPDVADAISSYDEHLGITTRPEFQEATPDEQAAAMTAMDLAENPNVPTPVELQPPFSPARVRDFGLTLVHQLGGEPRNYLHEVGVRAADDDALQYLKDAGYHESTGWLDRAGAQWWAYRKEYPLSVAKWAEQNPTAGELWAVISDGTTVVRADQKWTEEDARTALAAMVPHLLERGVRLSRYTIGKVRHHSDGGFVPVANKNPMPLRSQLVHAVTEYDRKQSGKPGYNRYAIGHYLGAVDGVMEGIEKDYSVRSAITNNFTGRLADYLLRTIGEASLTQGEQMGTGIREERNPIGDNRTFWESIGGGWQRLKDFGDLTVYGSIRKELGFGAIPHWNATVIGGLKREFQDEGAAKHWVETNIPDTYQERSDVRGNPDWWAEKKEKEYSGKFSVPVIHIWKSWKGGAGIPAREFWVFTIEQHVEGLVGRSVGSYQHVTEREFKTPEEAKQFALSVIGSPDYHVHNWQKAKVQIHRKHWDPAGDILQANPQDLGQAAFDAGKDFRLSGAYYETGVANAKVAKVGFTQWYNDLSPAKTKGKRKATLLKNWMEGWAAGKRIEKKGNPESEAASLYEDFHGKPPGEVKEIVTDKLEHEWLTQLGTLVELKVATLTQLDATIRFDKDAPDLCSSEDGRQLYIEGGDQSVDLKALKMDQQKWVKDSMTLGVLYELTYQTEKGFQNFKLTDYFHKLGEETGVQPFLLYDPRNKLLSITGGQYQTKPEGIVN